MLKYIAQGESQVTNIAQSKAECYICHASLTKSCILSYKRSCSALSVLVYLTVKDALLLTEDTPLKFNTLILLNKQIIEFFDKNVSIVLHFYNNSTVL